MYACICTLNGNPTHICAQREGEREEERDYRKCPGIDLRTKDVAVCGSFHFSTAHPLFFLSLNEAWCYQGILTAQSYLPYLQKNFITSSTCSQTFPTHSLPLSPHSSFGHSWFSRPFPLCILLFSHLHLFALHVLTFCFCWISYFLYLIDGLSIWYM